MAEISRRGLLAGAVAGGITLGFDGNSASAAQPDIHAGSVSTGNCAPASAAVAVGRSDPRYPSLITPWNRRFQGNPQNVHLVHTAQQVADVVSGAVAANKRIAVRSGGHCFENFTASPDIQELIDLSRMSDVYYDPKRRAFAVESGATLGQVYNALVKGWAVTMPGGICPGVGVGGHIAGGGYGFLSRRYGLAADHLYAVEVVVVDKSGKSRIVVATRDKADPNRDLWWAHTGGGGGNFGVVTRYWLRSPGTDSNDPAELLPRAPATMIRRSLVMTWEQLTSTSFLKYFRNYCNWFERNSVPDSPNANLWGGFFAFHKSAGPVGFIVGVDSGVPGAQSLVDAHCEAVMSGVGVQPVSDNTEVVPYLDDRNWNYEPYARSKDKAANLRKGFSDSQIATIYRRLNDPEPTNAGAALTMSGYGGKINAVAPGATATADRDSILRVYFTGGRWTAAADDAKNIKWIREFYRDVYSETGGVPVPNAINAGSYINYADADLADPAWNTSGTSWAELYFKSNYPRLQQIKNRYDPRNVFHHALSIAPR
ncbi:FAD-binding oxidoreductase [Micromonospora sp. NPDC092111]|uniref:FAD-binding oxidoreductase n=1 Tax=Micromonospora sp. NPDC092111 TaxID=3364289 RepID=UPI0037F57F98